MQEILWKTYIGTGECKNKHSNKFPKFLKIFGNLRKSLEKIAKCSKQPSGVFYFFKSLEISEVFGSLQMSLENF